MDINEIRRANLLLLKEIDGKWKTIGERASIDPNYLSQINTGYKSDGRRHCATS
jgi:hypothetical protein